MVPAPMLIGSTTWCMHCDLQLTPTVASCKLQSEDSNKGWGIFLDVGICVMVYAYQA